MPEDLHVDGGHAALAIVIECYERLRLADANEAETRLKVIDEILRSVLGWRLDDIAVEERVSEDGTIAVADYILRTASAAIVVEAKRAGASFELPSRRFALRLGGVLSEGELGDAIRQVRDFARSRSIQFAVATNGSAWVVFPALRADQVTFEDTQARVFRDLRDIKERFVGFWELLSRQRVTEGSLENQLLSAAREPNRRRLVATLSDSGYRLGRNSVYPLIEPAVAAAFMDETLLDDPRALEACYVKTAERVKYDSRLQLYVADAKPELDHPTTRVRSKKTSQALDKKIEAAIPIAPRFIVILGPVGAGKTTFLHYTSKISAAKAIQDRVLWMSADFKRATAADQPREFIFRELLNFIEADTSHSLGDFARSVSPAYRERIDNLRRGPLYLLAKSDKAEFDKRVADLIFADYKSVEPYVETVLRHATKTLPAFLIVDNVDQIPSDERQTEIFVEAQAAARRMQLTVVMTLREVTYQRNRSSPAFDAFQFDSLYIDAPSVTAVLSKRFGYAKRVLANKSADVHTEGGVRIAVPDLSIFFDIVARSVLDDDVGFMFEMLAGGDIRRGLQLVREFLASGHTSADLALAAYLRDGDYHFPQHEVFRGAVLGQRKYYREEESLVPNIFDAKLDSGALQLLRLKMCGWFVARHQVGPQEAVHAESITEELHRVGVSEGDVFGVLSQLCDFRVLRTADGLPFGSTSRLAPTRFAAYLLNGLAPSFAYFEMCLLDASIFDDVTWQDLEVLTRQIGSVPRYERIPIRVERAERFLEYLLVGEERWSVECHRHALDPEWSSLFIKERIKPALQADLVKVARSASRQHVRRSGTGLPGDGEKPPSEPMP